MAFGKTTIMKILQNLMNFNFGELIKYDFESIDLEVETKSNQTLKCTLKYTDLVPKNEEVIKYINSKLIISEDDLKKGKWFVKDNNFLPIDYKTFFNDILTDLIEKNKLNSIIRELAKKEEIYYYKYIIENEYSIYDDMYLFNNKFYPYEDIEEAIEKIIVIMKKFVINNIYNFVNKNEIVEIIKIINDETNKPIDILDMTKVYTFENNILISSLITNDNGVLKNESEDISNLRDSNLIKINSIINHYFYNEDFVKEINKIANSYEKLDPVEIVSLVDNIKKEDLYKYEIKDKFMKYIRPIIIKDSNFDKIPFHLGDLNNQAIFYDFFINKCNLLDMQLVEKNINPKMKMLQELLSKYMMNKDVEVTPMGLLIKSKEDNQNIPLNSLSSGEKKLLVIFMHCLFNEDIPIIIDEPEISLSIIWQENLLPDLLEQTNIKQIIVATHSAAVISDPCLDKYIVPLPNSMVDKGESYNESRN